MAKGDSHGMSTMDAIDEMECLTHGKGVRRMDRTETERVCELTEAISHFGAVFDDLVCYTNALRRERKALRTLVAGMYRDIGRAYVSGRPLEPYQYDDAMTELGFEVD